jgi:hypothetical protein
VQSPLLKIPCHLRELVKVPCGKKDTSMLFIDVFERKKMIPPIEFV